MLLTNNGYSKVAKIEKKSLENDFMFSGVFCMAGEESSHMGDFSTTFEVEKSKIARGGDYDLDEEEVLNFLKKLYPDFNEVQIDALYELIATESVSVYDIAMEVFEDAFRNVELFELSFMFQDIRGQIAANQGFDAIEMSDEYGTSYFIPYGSKAIIL